MLTAIETTATIGVNRQLLLDEDLPENVSSKAGVIVLFAEEDFSEKEWLKAASKNDAFDFLTEKGEAIYTLKDGEPIKIN
ncbi:MAG TPA: hypothetical protein VK892_22365 [Pyrinomonadaceae bacterium]|nr:hypothetical protein [Pyrinomonadaceae bacterium]